MCSGRHLRRRLPRGTSVALRELDRDIKAASAYSARAGRAYALDRKAAEALWSKSKELAGEHF
jgi:hypothetical protein